MIGIFDSGVGGMTVAKAVEEVLPGYPIIYLGDIARTPYGTKSASTIIEYSIRNTQFLIDRGATLIVIACNTASSVATEALKAKFSVPIIEVVTPAVEEALVRSTTGRIGIIGTNATVRSTIYERKIKERRPECSVHAQACPLFVPLVEEGWLNRQETKMIVRRYLHPLKNKQVDTLVLGCTHYPLLRHLIQPRIGRKVNLIDSSLAAAGYLKKFLAESKDLVQNQHDSVQHQYFVTDLTDSVVKITQIIFHREIELKLV